MIENKILPVISMLAFSPIPANISQIHVRFYSPYVQVIVCNHEYMHIVLSMPQLLITPMDFLNELNMVLNNLFLP